MPRTKKTEDSNMFPAKFSKVLGEEWMNECNGFDTEELKKLVIESEQLIEEQEQLRDNDEKLKEFKQVVKDLGGAYKDAIFYQRAKIKYAMKTLESRGKSPLPKGE